MEKSIEELFEFKDRSPSKTVERRQESTKSYNTLEERIALCRSCSLKHLDLHQGMVCGLTMRKPNFTEFCNDYAGFDDEFPEESYDRPKKKSKGGRIAIAILMSILGFVRAVIRFNEGSIFGVIFLILGIGWLLTIIFEKEN